MPAAYDHLWSSHLFAFITLRLLCGLFLQSPSDTFGAFFSSFTWLKSDRKQAGIEPTGRKLLPTAPQISSQEMVNVFIFISWFCKFGLMKTENVSIKVPKSADEAHTDLCISVSVWLYPKLLLCRDHFLWIQIFLETFRALFDRDWSRYSGPLSLRTHSYQMN